ncbi:hypothetical protein FNF27_07614 [Cafeteria roenbergensis]|uniref:ATPase ASNA1 homolog n=1 Tax=Cafeteria roenbergensis TaxID=33653 RepID=A0A5A8D430_CAFRO|nr:hypothetical protein FNF29_02977 [Cafeteria roenbergensis]KAA0159958.1 hypothetical protein FNF31_04603 [Cafeteria roenbergensis]KAA0162573.1 hypothetical protein FNF28_04666 [Cafeteria roenbergensis]KAA0165606.1 hypothetical protein FNF27_07614 [Cafeteria roenbergensis]|eukprot:KAA0153589.1 hypothetical protein FNF29_02977 [Cafeteria roenbergensis]
MAAAGATSGSGLGGPDEELPPMEPSLEELVATPTLQWVFVGGKGGVGKTTTSCSVALQLARTRGRVLLVSTDPAHNLSDAFGQKFGGKPSAVDGVENLFCMEIDTDEALKAAQKQADTQVRAAAGGGEAQSSPLAGLLGPDGGAGISKMVSDLVTSVPGVDEALSFVQMMGLVRSMDFDVVVFDTAPTGHTLRLLAFPDSLAKGLEAATALKTQLGPLLGMATSMMGPSGGDALGKISEQMEAFKSALTEVRSTLTDPERCTFVCVCIPEFLSLYETERLVQQLGRHSIDVANVVVNQVLWEPRGGAAADPCGVCRARRRVQGKYLAQIADLYEDFHVVKMPAMKDEVRGSASLAAFSEMLVKPYDGAAAVGADD